MNPSLTYLLWWQLGRWFRSSSFQQKSNHVSSVSTRQPSCVPPVSDHAALQLLLYWNLLPLASRSALSGEDVHSVAGVLFGLSGFWGVPLWSGDLDSFACLIYRTNVPMELLFLVEVPSASWQDEWATLNSARTWSLEAHWGENSKPQDLLPVVFANHKILANGCRFIFLVLEAFKWADGHFVVVLPPPWPTAQQPRRECDGCRCSWSRNLIMLWSYV